MFLNKECNCIKFELSDNWCRAGQCQELHRITSGKQNVMH